MKIQACVLLSLLPEAEVRLVFIFSCFLTKMFGLFSTEPAFFFFPSTEWAGTVWVLFFFFFKKELLGSTVWLRLTGKGSPPSAAAHQEF